MLLTTTEIWFEWFFNKWSSMVRQLIVGFDFFLGFDIIRKIFCL